MHKGIHTHAIPLLAALTATISGGCIKEDPADCPPVTPQRDTVEVMVVKAFDLSSKQEITISGRLDDGALFFFDETYKLLEDGYIAVSADKIGKEKPLPPEITSKTKRGDRFEISAWGNIIQNVRVVAYPIWGDDLTQEFLFLLPDETYDGYYLCPDELFFGMREMTMGEATDPDLDHFEVMPDGTVKLTHEVWITPLNAQLYIQVENLTDLDAANYYFQLEKQNSGYDYLGRAFLTDQPLQVRETGVFDNRNFLVSSAPFNLIPSIDADGNVDANSGMSLRLFQTGATRAEGDVDLTGAVNKVDYGDGNYIGLYSGQTTNVYIKFPEGGPGNGDIEVRVKVTPWGEIYQWSEWGK